jgi:hypothetical protein
MDFYKEIVQLSTPIMGAIALYIFQRMSDSISELNKNVAVVIEKIEKQEMEIIEVKKISERHARNIEELKICMAKKGCP